MSKKVKVTLTLPEDAYAVGDKIAEKHKTKLAAWIWAKIRTEARKEFNLDLDNPTPEDELKISAWIDEQTKKKRKHAKRAKNGGKIHKRTELSRNDA